MLQIEVVKVRSQFCDCWIFHSRPAQMTAFIAVANPRYGSEEFILASIRHLTDQDGGISNRVRWVEDAEQQTRNLARKLEFLDALGLTDTKFTQVFRTGRVFVVSDTNYVEANVWHFAGQCIREIEKKLEVRLITQPDYDQMKYHRILGGVLDGIDFKTKHDPSAIGTVTAFRTILASTNRRSLPTRWSLLGVGELGSRIVRLVVESRSDIIFAYDINEKKLQPFESNDRVRICKYEEWLHAEVDAVVMAGNSGSLTQSVAKSLMRNQRLIAVGGPEAGLDHDVGALKTLAEGGIHFVPSMLCGAMGLVSNLSEILGKPIALADQESGLLRHVNTVLHLAHEKRIAFHEALKVHLSMLPSTHSFS